MASRQMLVSLLKSGGGSEHLARTHLFLSSRSGLYRNKHWANIMESDVLIFDFQDGCPPGERRNVFRGLKRAHLTFPNKPLSVRLTELERDHEIDGGDAIKAEIKACIEQKQVRWLMLPMCDDKNDVQTYIDIVKSMDRNWLKNHGALQIILETPIGLHNLDDMLKTHPEIQGVIVGSGDYFRFNQGSKETFLPMLRWDIMNACLRHRRFPIDAPPFNINLTDSLPDYIKGAKDCGFKSAAILHPIQSKMTNNCLTESESDAEAHRMKADDWLAGRETGYKRGSGDDFVGPPHAKLSLWLAHHSSDTLTKRTFFIKDIDPKDIKCTRDYLQTLVSEQDSESSTQLDRNVYDNWTTVIFLAMVTTCHSRHKDILCNLGFSNVRFHNPNQENIDDHRENNVVHQKDAKFVAATLVSRRMTSAGDRVIAAYDCEVLDQKYKPIFSVRMFLMEKIIPFETFAKTIGDKPSLAELEKREDIVKAKGLATTITNDDGDIFKSPGMKLHSGYCQYLGLDAPLHHTTTLPPTVPSTLHLTCHRLPWYKITSIRDVCYHAQMKPDHSYHKKIQLIKDTKDGSSTWISIVKDASNGQLMSTVTFNVDDNGNPMLSNKVDDISYQNDFMDDKIKDDLVEKDEGNKNISFVSAMLSKFKYWSPAMIAQRISLVETRN